MAESKIPNAVLEGVRIGFRNFAGKEGQYNREGDRNFAVFLDEDTAEKMARDGWNVKHLNPRDEDEQPQAYLSVAVNFKGRPPRIVLISSRGKSHVEESMIDMLDWAVFSNVDLILNPYEWVVNGKSGVKAYLQSMFATLEEDELDRKYSEIPDADPYED